MTDAEILTTLKNSLKVPSDITDDDVLLNGYLNSAKVYILNACDSDTDTTSLVNDLFELWKVNAVLNVS